MANNKRLERGWFVDFEQVEVVGNFTTNGSSPVTNVVGSGYSVTRTGVGAFAVTFGSLYPKVTSYDADVVAPAPFVPGTGPSYLIPFTFNPAITTIWTMQNINASGTATELPTGSVINFDCVFGKSSLSK